MPTQNGVLDSIQTVHIADKLDEVVCVLLAAFLGGRTEIADVTFGVRADVLDDGGWYESAVAVLQ